MLYASKVNQSAFDFHIPNFKIMTTSNNNYTNEMLNQELSFQVLKAAAGGFKPNRTGINGDGLNRYGRPIELCWCENSDCFCG